MQTDRQDKSAHSWEEQQERVGTNYIKTKPDGGFFMSLEGGAGADAKFLIFSTMLWIWILLSFSKNSKKNLYFYCLMTSL